MASKSREVRLRQKEQVEKKLELRLAKLAERGLDSKTIKRDPTVRELRAMLTKARKRLAAIDAKEALVQSLAERKAKKAAEPAEKKVKKGKADKGEGKAAGGKDSKGKEKSKAKAKPKAAEAEAAKEE